MHRSIHIAPAFLAVFVCLLFVAPVSAQAPTPPYADLLVRFKGGLSQNQINQVFVRYGLKQVAYDGDLNVYRVQAAPDRDLQSGLNALAADSRVRLAEPNYRVKPAGSRREDFAGVRLLGVGGVNDPLFVWQWGLQRIQAPQAWKYMQGATNSIKLAVIDSGIDWAHPDLKPNLISGYNFLQPGTRADDGCGHGTAVAGIAGAVHNKLGIAGTGLNVRLMPLKIFDDFCGSGELETVARAIRYAARQKVRVVNLSLSTEPDPQQTSCPRYLQEQIDWAYARGVLLVAAAGNYASDIPVFPAACDHVLSVASTGYGDELSFFSDYGQSVDVAAPGEGILTTTVGDAPSGNYAYFDGTSASTPFVAGTAALVWQRHPGLMPLEVERMIESGADRPRQTGRTDTLGWGHLNTLRAILGSR